MKLVAETIIGYTFGQENVTTSPVTLQELESLKQSAGLTAEDGLYLLMAGEVLSTQTKQIVSHWRNNIIASNPHLSKHSRGLDGEPLPEYLAKSNLRFEQWILDTCLRPYDQDWLNCQQEIALRHSSLKKNRTDHVQSTLFVPLRDIIGFVAVMNHTIQPYLASKGHSEVDVRGMHRAWCKSLQLQLALWARPYTDVRQAPNEW